MTTLLLVWRWDNGTTQVHDFAADGEISKLVKEVAAALDLVDGGKAFRGGSSRIWRGRT